MIKNNSELGNEYLYETTFKITVDQPKESVYIQTCNCLL